MQRDLRRGKLAFGVLPSDRRYRLQRAKFPVMADEVAAHALRLGRPPRVLDAGIGQCRLERVYQHHHPELPVVWHGLDLLLFRVQMHPELVGIHRVQGDVNALPYRAEAFDMVACSWVLQHVEAPRVALAEFSRVLRPGGRLLLALPNNPQPFKLLKELLHPLLVAYRRRVRTRQPCYSPQIQFYNRRRAERLVRQAGLRPLRWQGLGFVTGGPLRFLENLRWYYRLNLWLGARLAGLCLNLVCVAEKSSRGSNRVHPTIQDKWER